MQHIWSWIKIQELNCLLKMKELKEEKIVIFPELLYDSRINIEAKINPQFSIPQNKMIVMLSYMDLKRIFKSTNNLNEYFENNLYKKNTRKKIGKQYIEKKRTRFFIVPNNFSEGCLKVLEKIANPKYKIDDLNILIAKAKEMQKFSGQLNSVEAKIKKSLSINRMADKMTRH